MIESNPDTLPTSADPGGLCSRCNRISNFSHDGRINLVHEGYGSDARAYQRAAGLRCQGCRESVVVIETRESLDKPFTPVLWWPTPGGGRRDPSIPDTVWRAYEEAIRCLSIQVPNAAAAMLRSVLAQIVQDKGTDEAKAKTSLNGALKQMVKDRSLHEIFEEWVGHIKDMGNAGAHPEIFGEVSEEEAEELRRLVEQLLNVLYVVPATITRSRNNRPPRP